VLNVSLQFGKTPLDIAVDVGRNDIHQQLHNSTVRGKLFHIARTITARGSNGSIVSVSSFSLDLWIFHRCKIVQKMLKCKNVSWQLQESY